MVNLLIIRELAKNKKITIREIADYAGVTEQGLQKMIRENKIKLDTLMKVAEKLNEPMETFVDTYRNETEARLTGSPETIVLHGVEHLTGFPENERDHGSFKKRKQEVSLKTFKSHVEVRLVTTKARAGFAGAYYADEYLDTMPTVLIETDKEYHGKYLAFEVDGDSMEPEYNAGDIIICREVKRDLWQYKLHYGDWDFVIAHGTKGIMLKEIVSHNVETGEIVCHSLNQDCGRNKDFTINLREVAFLYNVVERRISGKGKRRSR